MSDQTSFLQTIEKDIQVRIKERGITNDEELFIWAAKVSDKSLLELGLSEKQLETIKQSEAYAKSVSYEAKYRPLGYLTDTKSVNEEIIDDTADEDLEIDEKKEEKSRDKVNVSDEMDDETESNDSENPSSPNNESKQTKETGLKKTENDPSTD